MLKRFQYEDSDGAVHKRPWWTTEHGRLTIGFTSQNFYIGATQFDRGQWNVCPLPGFMIGWETRGFHRRCPDYCDDGRCLEYLLADPR